MVFVCRREATLQIGCVRFDQDRQVPGNAVSMKNLPAGHVALARSGSEGYRGEKPLSSLPLAALTSLHTGSHLSEDPGCRQKRTLHLGANANLSSPLSEAAVLSPLLFGFTPFCVHPSGLDKFAGTDVS